MLSTKALLNPFSALFAKVHHPPPLNHREAQRLLKALTVSFRNHLDKEHGFLSQEPPAANPSILKFPRFSATAPDPERRPTDRHVRAILNNPLFSYEPSKSVPHALSGERDPMDIFDQAVAKGLMTPKRATGVLIAKRQAIAQSSSASVHEGIAASGTAHRVVSWLRSSGLERDLSFAQHAPLLEQLIPFMVEEGLDDVVWLWLEMCIKKTSAISTASPILNALVRANVSPGASLNAGYSTMLRADSIFHETSHLQTLLGPWRTLSMLSTVFSWQRTPPSEALFDSFVAMSVSLGPLSRFISIDRAHLDLHHPTHPDANAALECLRSSLLDQVINCLQGGYRPRKDVMAAKEIAKSVVLMATDAVQHLTRVGKDADAEWVGDVLLDRLGHFMRSELVSASPELHRLESSPATG